MPLLIGLYFQKSANIWKRSHSGRNFHSRNQELIGTENPQTLEMMNSNDVRFAQTGSYGKTFLLPNVQKYPAELAQFSLEGQQL
jgi:hypothetical protein